MTALIPYRNGAVATSLQILGETADGFARSSRAPATRRAYQDDWDHFTAWCRAHHLDPMPAPAGIVGAYLSSLAVAKKSCSTIGRRLAAIRFAHRNAGAPVPKSDELTQVISGIRRELGVAPTKQKAAATVGIVTTVLHGIHGARPKDVRDRALIAIGFSAALRRSELVALNYEDLEFCDEGLRIKIRRSKTDQTGAGAEIAIPLGKHVFPVKLLRDWLELSQVKSGPIFRSIRRGGHILEEHLAGSAVARIIKARLQAVGIDESAFSGHSLRSGYVTSALTAGANILRVMDTTRHKQIQTLKLYDRKVRAFEDNAGDRFL